MSRVRHARISRTYPGTLRLIIGADAFRAPVGVDSVSSADSLIGAARPAISAVPGYSNALFGNDFVGYLRCFLSRFVYKIVAFRHENVNWGQSVELDKTKDRDGIFASRHGPASSSRKVRLLA
jgi:hypothetical protein